MFDLDAGKLIVIGVVALVVIGPKELPRVLRQVGQATAKLRRMAAEFQGQFMDAMREADIENLKKDVNSVADSAKFNMNFDPVGDIKADVSAAISPTPAAPDVTVPVQLGPEPEPVTSQSIAAAIAPPEPVAVETETLASKPRVKASAAVAVPEKA